MTDLRPRTADERRAYIDGWSNALISVHEDGFEEAQAHLRLLAEMERAPQADPRSGENITNQRRYPG